MDRRLPPKETLLMVATLPVELWRPILRCRSENNQAKKTTRRKTRKKYSMLQEGFEPSTNSS